MKIKVGPVTSEFRGKATMSDVDAVAHRLKLSGTGDDTSGGGSARMTMELSVTAAGTSSEVQVVADVETAPVTVQGPRIEHHPRFPARVNAGYMQVIDRATIALRVWERGAGETLACGTGACAAVVAGIRRGLLDRRVRVKVRGGELSIAWEADEAPVSMTGAAEAVFEGRWRVPG
jgi:diaminopimelate epimerase